ncbi:MAG: hypothetical protein ACKO96_46570, partial [Flammeovirgaceae bacterium]
MMLAQVRSKNSYPDFMLVDYFGSLGIKAKSLQDAVAPLATFTELIACPREFDFPNLSPPCNAHYFWPGLRKPDQSEILPFRNTFNEAQTIVYASLGSQPMSYGPESLTFFQEVVKAF